MGSMLKPTILLLLLQALVAKTSAATEPANCTVVSIDLEACLDILRAGVLIGDPPAKCCNGLKEIKDTEASLGIAQTCK